MAKQTAPRSPQLTADERIWALGYSRGYSEGHTEGLMEGAEAWQAWLREELATLVQDVRLGLKSDLATPLHVLAEVSTIVYAGKPVVVFDHEAPHG